MPYKLDAGDKYIIYSDTGEAVTFPKAGLAPDVVADIEAMKNLPTTAPITTTPAPTVSQSVKTSTPVSSNKYVGGGLGAFAAEAGKYAKSLQNPVLPEPPDPAAIRASALAETKTPIYTSAVAGIESQLRAQEFEKQQAEERRSLDLRAVEEEVASLQDDVKSYDVDPKYFWSGRPMSKEDKTAAKAKVLAEASRETTGEMLKFKGADTKTLAKAAIEQAKATKKGVAESKAMEDIDQARVGGKSNAERIGLIISAALVSYASGLQGKDPTAGLNMINNFIDRDIEMQRNELTRRSNLAQGKINFLGEMKDRFRDERAAELMTRASLKERFAIEMDKVQQRVTDADKKYGLDLMKQKTLQDAQQVTLQAKQLQLKAIESESEQTTRNRMLDIEEAKAKMKPDLTVPGMDFTREKTPTPEDAKKMNEARAVVKGVVEQIDDLILYVHGKDGVGWETYPSEEAAIAQAKLNDIMLTLKSEPLKNLGVLTGIDLDVLHSLVGKDQTGFWTTQNKLLLQDLRSRITGNFYAKARQYGYKELEFGDPTGVIQSR